MKLTKIERETFERFARLEGIPRPERLSNVRLVDAIVDKWNAQELPVVGVIEFGKPPQ